MVSADESSLSSPCQTCLACKLAVEQWVAGVAAAELVVLVEKTSMVRHSGRKTGSFKRKAGAPGAAAEAYQAGARLVRQVQRVPHAWVV